MLVREPIEQIVVFGMRFYCLSSKRRNENVWMRLGIHGAREKFETMSYAEELLSERKKVIKRVFQSWLERAL
jgi:hypothetical protein